MQNMAGMERDAEGEEKFLVIFHASGSDHDAACR